jgi:hypothetical protein
LVESSFTNPDEYCQVDFVRRADGLYSFHVWLRFEDRDGHEAWTPDPASDTPIFDSMETAQREAVARIPWLRSTLH